MRAPFLLLSAGFGLWMIAGCAPVGQRTHYQRWREETEQRHVEEAKAEAEAKALEAQKAGGGTRTATRAEAMMNNLGTPSIPPPPAGRVIRPQDTPPPPPPPTDDAVY